MCGLELLLWSGFCNSVYIKKDKRVCCINKVPFFPVTIILAVHEFLEFEVFLLDENTNFAGF